MYKSSIANEHFFFRLASHVFRLIFYTFFIPKIFSDNIINNLFIFFIRIYYLSGVLYYFVSLIVKKLISHIIFISLINFIREIFIIINHIYIY